MNLNWIKKTVFHLIAISLFLLTAYVLCQKMFQKPGYIYTGQDFPYHLTFIEDFSKRMGNGDYSWPVIFNTINYHSGYGAGLFYPQLPHMIAGWFVVLTGSLTKGIRLFDFVGFFTCGLSMYFLCNVMKWKWPAALLSALGYETSYYLMVDLLQRNAHAEYMIAIYLPLALAAFMYLYHGRMFQFYFWFVLSWSLMILTHLMMSIYAAAAIGIYVFFQKKKIWNLKILSPVLIACLFTLGITSFFWMPLLKMMKMNYYVASGVSDFVLEGEGIGHFTIHTPPLSSFFTREELINQKNGLFFQFNSFAILFPLAVIYCLLSVRIWKKKGSVFWYALLGLILCLSIITASPELWAGFPRALRMIQFPWRLSLFACFYACLITGFGLNQLLKTKYFRKHEILTLGLSGIAYVLLIMDGGNMLNYFHFLESFKKSDYYKDASVVINYDYMPAVTANNSGEIFFSYEYPEIRTDGDAITNISKFELPDMEFEIENNTGSTFELSALYYPGYSLLITSKDGTITKPAIQPSKNGYLQFTSNQNGKAVLSYTGTLLMKFSKIFSFIFLILFTLFLLFIGILQLFVYFQKRKRKKRKAVILKT